MQITLGYPLWTIGLSLLLGIALAGLLYFRDTQFREKGAWLTWLLATLRFAIIFLISIFLLDPVIRFVHREIHKPVVLLLQDVSESVAHGWTGGEKAEHLKRLENLEASLRKDFNVRTYSLGSSVREGLDTTFSDKSSNISEALRSMGDQYSGDHVAAVLLASDGIYNAGSNPLYVATRPNAPVFSVALGDTVPAKDLILKRVFYNKIAYLGDQFSIQADISAVHCKGSSTKLSVYKVEGNTTRLLRQTPLNIDRADYFSTQEIILDAEKSGIQRYRLSLTPLRPEASLQNNTQDIFIEVLDSRQKILILANAPHPDISALRQGLLVNKNYEVETAFIRDFNANISAYNLVIFHQLPSKTNNLAGILTALQKNRTPRWFIAGLQTDFARLNQIQELLSFQADTRSANEVQASVQANFNLFVPDEKLLATLSGYPPLLTAFGEFRSSPQAQVLLGQRIRKIDTNYPLLAFGEPGGIRTGVFAAEGFWRWRLFNYLQEENHQLIDDWLSKMVQYLSVREDKRKFRVSTSKHIYDENEPVQFDAELYNNTFERINEPDVRLRITNPAGKEFTFTMNKNGKAYTLNAGVFSVGNYAYQATVLYGGEQLKAEGTFSVQPVQLESYETTANHNILRMLSSQSGGEMLYSADMASLSEKIRQLDTAKPVIYEQASTRSLINLRWLFGLLLLLLSTEWFLRRYFGSY